MPDIGNQAFDNKTNMPDIRTKAISILTQNAVLGTMPLIIETTCLI